MKEEYRKQKEQNEETIMGGWSTRCEVLKQCAWTIVDLFLLSLLACFISFVILDFVRSQSQR